MDKLRAPTEREALVAAKLLLRESLTNSLDHYRNGDRELLYMYEILGWKSEAGGELTINHFERERDYSHEATLCALILTLWEEEGNEVDWDKAHVELVLERLDG